MQIPAPSVDEDEEDEETTILATHHLWFPGFLLLGYTTIITAIPTFLILSVYLRNSVSDVQLYWRWFSCLISFLDGTTIYTICEEQSYFSHPLSIIALSLDMDIKLSEECKELCIDLLQGQTLNKTQVSLPPPPLSFHY